MKQLGDVQYGINKQSDYVSVRTWGKRKGTGDFYLKEVSAP